MKNWINRHLNWLIVITHFGLIWGYGIFLAVFDELTPPPAFAFTIFAVLILVNAYVLFKKGRSLFWMLTLPLTGFIFPLMLANKNTGQYQNSKTPSGQTVQHRP